MPFIRFFSRRLTLSVFYLVTLSLSANATNPIINQQAAYELGREYLNLKSPDLLLNAFRESDSIVSNSIVFDYGQCGWFSPTNLRYVKVACDLREQFKDLNKMHIVEIGGGYGQCKILADLVGFASYTIIGLPEKLALRACSESF